MDFIEEQLSEVFCKHAERENGLHDLMEIMLESMMLSERREYLSGTAAEGNKGELAWAAWQSFCSKWGGIIGA